MADVRKYAADKFCRSIMRHAKLTPYDAIYIRNSFIPNKNTEFLVVSKFNGYNDDNDAIVKIVANRETGKVLSYTIRQDLEITPIGIDLAKWLDAVVKAEIAIDINYSIYKKHHDLLYEADNITVIATIDPIIEEDILHYFFNEKTKDIFRCIEPSRYKYHPEGITWTELEELLAGLADGKRILSDTIGTDHIQDKAITPKKLSERYALYYEIYDARIDGIDNVRHESLKDHLNVLAEYIAGLRETTQYNTADISLLRAEFDALRATIVPEDGE